jgi:hypothetical protein
MSVDQLYRAGKFAEADHAYREGLAAAGALALLHNRLDDAERLLSAAPPSERVLRDLAEVAYRRDDFASAAARLGKAGGADPVIRKLLAFDGVMPYRSERRDVHVPFEIVDPLPVVDVTLGDGRTVPFFLDTGGHEVYLDETLAAGLGVPTFGVTHGVGAGGKHAVEGHGVLPAMTLGGLLVEHVPVKLLDFTALGFADALGGVDVKGVLGTAFLYHYLATIDYACGELVLRPRTPERLRAFERDARSNGLRVVPFWLSGTHLLVVEGSVNGVGPMPLVVDTGGAGLGFVGTRSTVDRAGLTLLTDQEIVAPGAGGAARAVPLVVDELTLGEVTARDLGGVYFPDTDLEKDLDRDFPVGGIVSHQFFRPHALTLDFTGMRLFL